MLQEAIWTLHHLVDGTHPHKSDVDVHLYKGSKW